MHRSWGEGGGPRHLGTREVHPHCQKQEHLRNTSTLEQQPRKGGNWKSSPATTSWRDSRCPACVLMLWVNREQGSSVMRDVARPASMPASDWAARLWCHAWAEGACLGINAQVHSPRILSRPLPKEGKSRAGEGFLSWGKEKNKQTRNPSKLWRSFWGLFWTVALLEGGVQKISVVSHLCGFQITPTCANSLQMHGQHVTSCGQPSAFSHLLNRHPPSVNSKNTLCFSTKLKMFIDLPALVWYLAVFKLLPSF